MQLPSKKRYLYSKIVIEIIVFFSLNIYFNRCSFYTAVRLN
jgi:hypothetical protein